MLKREDFSSCFRNPLRVYKSSHGVGYRKQIRVVSGLRGFLECIGRARPPKHTVLSGYVRLGRWCPLNAFRADASNRGELRLTTDDTARAIKPCDIQFAL